MFWKWVLIQLKQYNVFHCANHTSVFRSYPNGWNTMISSEESKRLKKKKHHLEWNILKDENGTTHTNTRVIACCVPMSQTTVWRVLDEECLQPFYIFREFKLCKHVITLFCQWFMQHCAFQQGHRYPEGLRVRCHRENESSTEAAFLVIAHGSYTRLSIRILFS